MNLNKDPSSWARVSPDAVLSGSDAQRSNVLHMAKEDIARLWREVERLRRIAKPFADIADRYAERERRTASRFKDEGRTLQPLPDSEAVHVRLGDCRAARDALE